MRVLHITQSIAGGPASYFEEIAEFQTSAFGPDGVRFLVPAGNRHHLPSLQSSQILEFAPCGRSLVGLLALAAAASAAVKQFDPAVVHLHSTYAGVVVRPTMMFATRSRKVVYCAHGWSFEMEVPTWKRNVFALIERMLVPMTDAIVNISHCENRAALMYGLPSGVMTTIRNGISAVPRPQTGALLQVQHSASAFDSAKIHLVFLGRHDRQKGLDYLLDVFSTAAVRNVHLHVIGAPVLGAGSWLPKELDPGDVTVYGWLPRDTASAIISNADALIMPSRWEGFGLAAIEAMRLGKPVLASRRGALAEIVQDGVTGMLFDLEKPMQLIQILRDLDRRTLKRMGEAARVEFLRSFDAQRMNAELLALYRSLIKDGE